MSKIVAEYPYLICEYGGEAVGFAYASRYNERDAYRYSADLSIYLKPGFTGNGIGRALYTRLLSELYDKGIYTVFACLTASNTGSAAFHAALGFTPAGVLHHAGYKHGEWHDILWLEKSLREYGAPE